MSVFNHPVHQNPIPCPQKTKKQSQFTWVWLLYDDAEVSANQQYTGKSGLESGCKKVGYENIPRFWFSCGPLISAGQGGQGQSVKVVPCDREATSAFDIA